MVAAAIALLAGCRTSEPRDVVIVARGMAFALPNHPDEVNPLLHLRAGERVRVTLRNDAPGLMHNFEIPRWGIKTEAVRAGQTASVTFTVPDTQAPATYVCRPHAEMMHGVVEVAPP